MARILFVEDEKEVSETLHRFFTREGYDVYTADSQTTAKDLAARFPPDVLVLDVMLNHGPEPEFDGFAVCKTLRDGGYTGPVIFVTARTMEQDKLRGFELGADDYVTKPFSPQGLLERLRVNLIRATLAVNIGQEA